MNTTILNKVLNDEVLFIDVNNKVFTDNCNVKIVDGFGHLINYGICHIINHGQKIVFKYDINGTQIKIDYEFGRNTMMDKEWFKEKVENNKKYVRCFGFLVHTK